MAKFSKSQVIGVMRDTGIVPVFYHSDAPTACNVLKACYDGGIRVFEFANRGDFAHEVFRDMSKFAAAECPGMMLGIGSVVDAGTASLYIQMGVCFVVGPLFNPDVAKVCNRRLVPYIPGCGTVSEIGFAQEAGCDVCKVFPAENVGGPSFVKNVLAPMPWSQLMVTGGVEPTRENLSAWMKAGVACVGMGSNLFPKDMVEGGDWGGIEALCRQALGIVAEVKGR